MDFIVTTRGLAVNSDEINKWHDGKPDAWFVGVKSDATVLKHYSIKEDKYLVIKVEADLKPAFWKGLGNLPLAIVGTNGSVEKDIDFVGDPAKCATTQKDDIIVEKVETTYDQNRMDTCQQVATITLVGKGLESVKKMEWLGISEIPKILVKGKVISASYTALPTDRPGSVGRGETKPLRLKNEKDETVKFKDANGKTVDKISLGVFCGKKE